MSVANPTVVGTSTPLSGALGKQVWGPVKASALNWSGNSTLVTETNTGLGVTGGRTANTIDYDPLTGHAESMRLKFGGPVDSVTLRIGQMTATKAGYAELGTWQAVDAQGKIVATGLLDPRGMTPVGTDTYDFHIDPAVDFTRLIVAARKDVGLSMAAPGQADGSDFSILQMSYVPVTPHLVITQSGGATAVTEGGAADSFTVMLSQAPTAITTIDIAGSPDLALTAPGGATGTGAKLTFTAENWNVAQTVKVAALTDGLVEGTETAGLGFTAHGTDPLYGGLTADALPVVITDATVAPTPPGGTAPAGAIHLHAGDNIQAAVNAAGQGATFWLEAGEYRMQSIVPKAGQSFLGDDGAVLNGSRELSGFVHSGTTWYVGGQTQQGLRIGTEEALPGSARGGYPDSVFFDDHPLTPVASVAAVKAGTYYFDYAADRIYIGSDPTGHSVEAAVTPYAFQGGATGVTVSHLVVEKYAAPIQRGAIGGDVLPAGWTIQDNEVRLNFGVGIAVGNGTKVLGNVIHDNGNMGVAGVGKAILFDGNEIASNGAWSGIDPYWEGGGSKFAKTDGLVVRNNYVHDNAGYGLWTDVDNIHTLYEGNRVVANAGSGINHEISYDAVIRNNVLTGNGTGFGAWLFGAGVQIQNSSKVEVYGNTVDMTTGANGITLIQQERGSGAYGAHTTTGNNVHDNTVISRTPDHGAIGASADYDEAAMLAGGNVFDHNIYQVTSAADDRFAWGDWYDWASYRAVSGWDTHSSLVLI